jgi:copper ion binding protein
MKETLTVKNMHCTSCEKLIESTVSEIKGVKSIKASYAKETVDVEFDPSKTSLDAITKAINKLGYEAKVKNAETEKKRTGFLGLFGRK